MRAGVRRRINALKRSIPYLKEWAVDLDIQTQRLVLTARFTNGLQRSVYRDRVALTSVDTNIAYLVEQLKNEACVLVGARRE